VLHVHARISAHAEHATQPCAALHMPDRLGFAAHVFAIFTAKNTAKVPKLVYCPPPAHFSRRLFDEVRFFFLFASKASSCRAIMRASDHSPNIVWSVCFDPETSCCSCLRRCYRTKPGFRQEFCSADTAPLNEVNYVGFCHCCAQYDVIRAVKPGDATTFCVTNSLLVAILIAVSISATLTSTVSYAYKNPFSPYLLDPVTSIISSAFLSVPLVQFLLCVANCIFSVRRRNASRKLVGIDEMSTCETLIEVGCCDKLSVHQEMREARARASLVEVLSGASKGSVVERANTAGGSQYVATTLVERLGSASRTVASPRGRSPTAVRSKLT
jgi:hypothetical protein